MNYDERNAKEHTPRYVASPGPCNHAVKQPVGVPTQCSVDVRAFIIAEANEPPQGAYEVTHRGQRIKDALATRRAIRRNRRQRKTRYRQPRFLNRTRPADWLPPSLASRVANVMTWVKRLTRVCPKPDAGLPHVQPEKGQPDCR